MLMPGSIYGASDVNRGMPFRRSDCIQCGERTASIFSRMVSLNGFMMPLFTSRGRVVRVGVSTVRTSTLTPASCARRTRSRPILWSFLENR